MSDMPEDPCDVRFEEARQLIEAERFREAVAAFTDFIQLVPESEGAYGNRGLAFLSLGEDERALADFERVVSINPDDAMGYAMMGEALRFLGRAEEALAYVAEALEFDPEEPTAHCVRGWLFAEAGQHRCAVEDFEIFIEGIEEPGEVEDLIEICRLLALPDACDEDGLPLDTEEARAHYLARHGFSFDCEYNADYETEGQLCPYAHCIRGRPRRGQESPSACPVFGYDCPGGADQVGVCQEHGLEGF